MKKVSWRKMDSHFVLSNNWKDGKSAKVGVGINSIDFLLFTPISVKIWSLFFFFEVSVAAIETFLKIENIKELNQSNERIQNQKIDRKLSVNISNKIN